MKAVRDCYRWCDLASPSWLASHFSGGLFGPSRRYIKVDGGYRLENTRREEIANLLSDSPPISHSSTALSRLEVAIPLGPKREFLQETIKCFGVGAHRAAVLMCWNLAAHHLQDYILADPVRNTAFNNALVNNTDTRVKIRAVTRPDDFTEMSEAKFLLFCREARVITSSMYNKLKTRLDERNSAAHPSGVKTTPKAAEAYIEDLTENVLMKFIVSE